MASDAANATCSHLQNAVLRPYNAQRDGDLDCGECALCFATSVVCDEKSTADTLDEDVSGIFVCLTCFTAGCHDHAMQHGLTPSHSLSLRVRRVQKPPASPSSSSSQQLDVTAAPDSKESAIKRLRFVPDPATEEHYETVSTLYCFGCKKEVKDQQEKTAATVHSILNAAPPSFAAEVKAWELDLTSCSHVDGIDSLSPLASEPKDEEFKCKDCGLLENLWMCLHCGAVGCGRAQLGGLNGNGHALAHATVEKSHAVAVKIGTFAREQDGAAPDVYCYSCNEERVDKNIHSHLLRVGVDVSKYAKRTVKSLLEMQAEQNLKFDFTMTGSDGSGLRPAGRGPFCTGLKNLGNTCYINSVVQALVHAAPEVRESTVPHYTGASRDEKCKTPLSCHQCTWHKLIDQGLASGKHDAVAPGQWRRVICKGHHAFSSSRQQDASEFLAHLIKTWQLQVQTAGGLGYLGCFNEGPNALLHTFVQRLSCVACTSNLGCSEGDSFILQATFPPEVLVAGISDDTNKVVHKNGDPEDEKVSEVSAHHLPRPHIKIADLLQHSMNDVVDYACSVCGHTQAKKVTGLCGFPKVLVVVAQRFLVDKLGEARKSMVEIDFGSNLSVDLTFLHAEPKRDDESETAPQGMQHIIELGFPERLARKALAACDNNLESAVEWALTHANEPLDDNLSSNEFAAQLPMLSAMGFVEAHALRALKATNGDLERAVDWCFSHPFTEEHDPLTNQQKQNEKIKAAYSKPGVYHVAAFINHKGPSVHSGHYVCHAKDAAGRWLLFNDDRVVEQTDIQSLLPTAYIYFLRLTE